MGAGTALLATDTRRLSATRYQTTFGVTRRSVYKLSVPPARGRAVPCPEQTGTACAPWRQRCAAVGRVEQLHLPASSASPAAVAAAAAAAAAAAGTAAALARRRVDSGRSAAKVGSERRSTSPPVCPTRGSEPSRAGPGREGPVTVAPAGPINHGRLSASSCDAGRRRYGSAAAAASSSSLFVY